MATPTATATPTARSASGMSTGAKIGAGVGAGVVGVLLVLLLVFFVLRCRRAQRVGAAPTEQPLEGLRHGKEINLTGKQVLGIDDDSYMRELPITELSSYDGLPLTVAPAHYRDRLDDSKYAYKRLDPPDEGGVSPWDVEYKPNPVIFPHLVASSSAARSPTSTPSNNPQQASTRGYEVSPVSSLTRYTASSSNDANLSSSSCAPSRSTSGTGETKGSRWVMKDVFREKMDAIPWKKPDPRHGNRDASLELRTISTPGTISPPTDDSGSSLSTLPSLVPTSTQSSAPSSIPTTSPSQVSTESSSSLQYACPSCNLTFQTKGLRRTHINRKHNLRFSCTHCPAAFGLRADLGRHQRTVHKQLTKPSNTFQCEVPGCAASKKVFTRKDNFLRHVDRCRKAAVKGKGKERDLTAG